MYLGDYLPLPNIYHLQPPALPRVPPRPDSNILTENNSFVPIQPPISRPLPPSPENQPDNDLDNVSTEGYSESETEESSQDPSSPESEAPVPLTSYPLTSPACPPVPVPSPPGTAQLDPEHRHGTLSERIAILRGIFDVNSGDSNQSPTDNTHDMSITSSPNRPSSSTTTTQSPIGLNTDDNCDIPIVEILNIDSTLPHNTPRCNTPDSQLSDSEVEIDDPASPETDAEIRSRVNSIVHHQ